MTDEPNRPDSAPKGPVNPVDNDLEALLPAPEKQPDSSIEPGLVGGPEDDLLPPPGEADTSADDASTREELEVDTTSDGVDDFIPLHGPNDDSFAEDAEAQAAHGAGEPSGTCLICGQKIGSARFCPDCGTEQVPASRIVTRLSPMFMWSRPLAIRVTFSLGALLALLALLADSGATAMIITASTLAMVILIRLADQTGGLSKNGWIQVLMMVLVGTAIGLPIAWLATRLARRVWFEGGIFNFGAANFGGIAVDNADNAPFLVWLTNGILLPLVALLVIGAAPAALRMALAMTPRESTGMVLSAAVGVGYVIGSAMVYYWGFYSEMAPIMSTSEWTLTILGIAVVRPLVWVYSSAMLGTVVWRFAREASLPAIAVPSSIAIAIPLLYNLASIAIAPAGLWFSILVGLVFATSAVYLHTRFLKSAQMNDVVPENKKRLQST